MNCDRCGSPAPRGHRYCADCRKAVRAAMRESGYLQVLPPRTTRTGGLSPDGRYLVNGSGGWDNAVKSFENGK